MIASISVIILDVNVSEPLSVFCIELEMYAMRTLELKKGWDAAGVKYDWMK